MIFRKVLAIMMISGLTVGIILGIVYGPSMIEDLHQYLLDSWAGNLFKLVEFDFVAEAQLSIGNHYIISISDSVEIKDSIDSPCEESGPLCDYEIYMSTEHEVNIADAIETRNSFAGEIGE